jgi:hypothetical protein
MTRAQAMYFLAACCVAVGAFGGRRKTTFIKVDEGCLLLLQLTPAA